MTLKASITMETNLPEMLAAYKRYRQSNITPGDLEQSIAHRIPHPLLINAPGVKPIKEKVYFFFEPSKGDLEVAVPGKFSNAWYVPLSRDMYGFPESDMVEISPDRASMPTSPEAGKRYDALLERPYVPLGELLETVGSIVNDSMLYDFDAIPADSPVRKHEQSYQPSGDESVRGICRDAGRLIRELLQSLNLPENIKFLPVSIRGEDDVGHDTTYVFDTQTGHWAIINSKSPSKTYNLVPSDRFDECVKQVY